MEKQNNFDGKVEFLVEGKRDRQRDPVHAFCGLCKGEIYLGQNFYQMEQGPVCMDCLEEYAKCYFLSNLRTAMPDLDHDHDA